MKTWEIFQTTGIYCLTKDCDFCSGAGIVGELEQKCIYCYETQEELDKAQLEDSDL